MACPRARLILVLAQMNLTNPHFTQMMDLFDELRPVEKAIHEAELHILRLDADVERNLCKSGSPAVDGMMIPVVRKIEEKQ